MPGSPTLPRHTKGRALEADLLAAQQRDCSWSHKSEWGKAAAIKFIAYGKTLGDRLCHDDVVADFGGNDGYASHEFYVIHKVKPIVIDCDPMKIDFAARNYGLDTCETMVEEMPFPDKYVDWGFCCHTAEHFQDTGKALREMSRVIRRGCAFVLPLEDHAHGRMNHAHHFSTTRPRVWERILRENGWAVIDAVRHPHEYHVITEPK
jgi:SAM-dependent methyltransferase